MPPPQLYDLLLDGPALQSQQLYLRTLLTETTEPFAHSQLQGILSLLESIAEQAYDMYGINAIPGPVEEVLAAYLVRRGVSNNLRTYVRIALDLQPPQFDTPAQVSRLVTQLLGPDRARQLLDSDITQYNQAAPAAPQETTPPHE